MRIPILTFGAIASVLTINSVMADTTVTSKTYVDTTRQATIPAAGTNEDEPGTTVVTYTDTAGTIGERGILEPNTLYNASRDANKLLTAGQLDEFAGFVDQQIQNIQDNLPAGATCYERLNGECILVSMPVCMCSCDDRDASGNATCNSDGTCDYSECYYI